MKLYKILLKLNIILFLYQLINLWLINYYNKSMQSSYIIYFCQFEFIDIRNIVQTFIQDFNLIII